MGVVKNPTGSVSRLTTPIKAWTQRFAFLFLVVGAFALMLIGKADTVLVERIRGAVGDAAAPILEFIARPIDTIGNTVEGIGELTELRARNATLERENERLRHWQVLGRRLEAENAALRSLTDMVPDPRLRFITARVVGDQGGAFARSILVNAGSRDGVAKGQAAITSQGLAGRVAEVGVRASRVLLVTDINSRIPVLIGVARDRAVLAGDNTGRPRLLYLAADIEIHPGDHVVTSGHGGVFPPGLPIGVVTQASETALRVQPFVDWAHMEFLRLADYKLPSLPLSPGDGGGTPGDRR
jgi:rod shape-determining protein MreC